MADKVISATLKVNTGTSAEDIAKINDALKATGVEVKTVEEGAKSTTGTFDTLKEGLGKIPGPLSAVNRGVETVSTSLKALAANPIVLVITLLVAALYAVYKAFTSTEAGAEKVEQIFSGLGAIVNVIRDRILALAGAVADFFSGHFSKALSEAKAAVTGVGDAIVQAYGEAADATRELQEAEDELNRTLTVSRAKLERDLAATKELVTDETASYKDRKAAIEEVKKAEGEQTQAELDNAKKTLDALNRKLALDKDDSDLKDQIAKQEATVFGIQERQAQDIRALNRQNHQIDQQEQQKANEAAQKAHETYVKQQQEKIALEKELAEISKQARILAQGDIVRQSEIEADALQQRKDAAEAQKKIDDERIASQQAVMDSHVSSLYTEVKAEKAAADKNLENIARQYAAEQALKQFRIDTAKAVGNALGALADLIGKQTIAGKALAIAQATINTWLGVTEVLRTPSVLPEPLATISRIANITAVIASGLSAIKNIAKTNPGSSSGSDIGTISTGTATAPSAPVAPTQQGTTIDQTSIAGIGNAVSGRSYVLAQDVTHDQDRNERLNRAARLGG